MNADPTSLDRLHDIVAPPATPWWPPAPGWYWLLGFLLVVVLVLVLRAFLHWQRNRYRREALMEWRWQEALLHDPGRRAPALGAMAELLKRAALSAFPREQVASLTGAPWLAFLDRTAAMTGFSSDTGALLESAAYHTRSASALDDTRAREAAELVRHWLEHHRADNPPRPRSRPSSSNPTTGDRGRARGTKTREDAVC